MFVVYILQSLKYQKFYTGYTNRLGQRLQSHNAGKVRSTKAFRPWTTVYTEHASDKHRAHKREREIKSYKGGNAFKKLITIK